MTVVYFVLCTGTCYFACSEFPAAARRRACVSGRAPLPVHTTVLHGVYGSNFELNTMFPVTSRNLNESIDLLSNAVNAFTEDCLLGLEATTAGPDGVERGLMLGTALAPVIGYDKAAAIAKTAAKEGKTIREVALRDSDLSEEQLQELLEPISMTHPQEQ